MRGGALHVRAYVASPADLKQLNAPPAQMALKQPMMGMGVPLDPQVPRRAVLVPRDAVPVSE